MPVRLIHMSDLHFGYEDVAALKAAARYATETPFDPKAKVASIRLFPADALSTPGGKVTVSVKYLDDNGRELPEPSDAKLAWTLPLPPKTPTGRSI